MEYDRGDSFPFDFEPNGIPFGSKAREKLSPRSYPVQFERKWDTSFLSASKMNVSLRSNSQITLGEQNTNSKRYIPTFRATN